MDVGAAGAPPGPLLSGGAVACPVCTLYLREGISLQRHLDTHPKEQVIEALIKASTGTPQTLAQPPQPPPQPPPTPSMQTSPGGPQVTQSPHVSTQSPYPIGPVFECPPIGTMMPPQFASFSYQQFVNNGTMMIPQYAMAPQANQMMQMLYNPYGMYQQQQIPTVQMISPIATIPAATTRIRPVMTGEDGGSRSTGSVGGGEPKQILPEILPESETETERVLPDIELPSSPVPQEEMSGRLENVEVSTVHVEHRGQQTQNSTPQEQMGRENEYRDMTESIMVENHMVDDSKAESVLPDIEDNDDPMGMVSTEVQCKQVQYERAREQLLPQEYESEDKNDADGVTSPVIDVENEEEKTESSSSERSDAVDTVCIQLQVANEEAPKETNQPEVEQLERLLITIMESEFNTTQAQEKATPGSKDYEEDLEDKSMLDQEEITIEKTVIPGDVAQDNCDALTYPEVQDNERPDDADDGDRQSMLQLCVYVREENFDQTYRYKHSLSAPASPVLPKKSHRTYSVHAEFGFNENLTIYPMGFDAAALHDEEDDEDDEKNDMEDNFDEEDMEIEEITSPHTPYVKQSEGSDRVRSHTPLSTISGISVLRVRTDLSKPCSPASMHSFCHLDTDSVSHDEESNDTNHDLSAEKDPIDCSHLEHEAKVTRDEVTECTNSTKELETVRAYHQSVITEHQSSFPVIHSQPPLIIQDTYTMGSVRSPRNLLNLSESTDPTTSFESKNFQPGKSILQKPTTELLNINEDAHAGPMNVFEFDGLQILVPSTFISESSQKAVSATSQQSMASSEGGAGIDEEVKSVNMRADETMPPRGELSEQESNGCTEHSAWQLYMGQESSRMSTSYDLMARESWEESEGSDNEIGGPLLDSRSLATHFTSSLFLDRDRKTPTKRTYKCPHCSEVFDCPKERRVHATTVHKEAGPSSSRDPTEQPEVKDIKLLDGRMNVFEDIFVPGLHMQQTYHQQPLLHQLQPPQQQDLSKGDADRKIDSLVIPPVVEVTCTMCNQRFSSEKSLQIHHRRMHVNEMAKRVRDTAKCQICNEEFPSVVLFNAHLKIHPLECSQCGKYFYRKQNFKLHMKRHLGIKPFPCTVCDKAFLTKQKLDEHTNGHTGNAPVKCNLCNETFRRYSNLTQHKNRHHLNIKKKLKDYICHCGEVFHTKKKLAWHKETHDEKPKACTYCNERFIHMASLTRHMRRAHNRRFVPDAQRESENVECPICKCIYLRSSLAVHMRVHNGERPYECQVCSKAFSTKWNLQLHKWTHAARSTKPFKCNQCSAAFYRHSDYTAHMNSHRNVRPYTCNYCGAQFIRKYNCLRHVKEHEENKAYTCDVCNKTFHRSYYLKEHLRVHSGARPYTCHICGKSSSTKSNHNKHVRIHHAREPVNTEN